MSMKWVTTSHQLTVDYCNEVDKEGRQMDIAQAKQFWKYIVNRFRKDPMGMLKLLTKEA